ncbi:MAG: transposase zinc-binding domain-containing protein [Coriobacteriales bacterium]|jgi:hypothetical protein|nr:transposase zinc-binding domain-containing protein [Coriobacteriales bacterium]
MALANSSCSSSSASTNQLVDDYFETLERVWAERYLERYGFWRAHFMRVIWDYLDCGNLHNGFARIRCADCGHIWTILSSAPNVKGR